MRLSEVALYETLRSLASVASSENFVAWSKGELQSILPHGAFIGGLGQIDPTGIRPSLVVSASFPCEYLAFIRGQDKPFLTPVVQRWLQTGKPQVHAISDDQGEMSEPWLSAMKASGLQNIISHGVYDSSHRFASYFSFHQVPLSLGESQKQLLELVVPGMHTALLRIHRRSLSEECATSGTLKPDKLSRREKEILLWICKGKTNYEIAAILGISYKTAKNHVQSILIKLRVNNRAQAAAKAIELKLCDIGNEID